MTNEARARQNLSATYEEHGDQDRAQTISSHENWDTWDPMGEDYHSERNTLALNPDKDPLACITGQANPIASKIGAVKLCERFARLGDCADGNFCDKLHVNPSARAKIWKLQNTFETNKNRICLNFTYLSPYELEPSAERLLLISVTDVKSPANFYMIAPYDNMDFAQKTTEDLDFYINHVQQHSAAKRRLQRCHEQLAALFDHSYRIDNLNDEIYKSQIVACKLKDGLYRRAMVFETPDFSMDQLEYKLFLIDVGIEVYLPREMIFDIKASCLSDPPIAINSRLAIKPAGGESSWSEDAMDFFTARTRGVRYLLCKVLNYIELDRIFTVELFNTKKSGELTNMMISKGLAERCDY